jgi:hypothetical protein
MKKGSAASSLIQKLVFLGRNESPVEIDGVTFVLGSLSEGQTRDMVSALFKLDDAERVSLTKSVAVATSLVSIDGIDIDIICEGAEVEGSAIEKRISIVSKMQASIVSKLFKRFEEINSESEMSDKVIDDLKN